MKIENYQNKIEQIGKNRVLVVENFELVLTDKDIIIYDKLAELEEVKQ